MKISLTFSYGGKEAVFTGTLTDSPAALAVAKALPRPDHLDCGLGAGAAGTYTVTEVAAPIHSSCKRTPL